MQFHEKCGTKLTPKKIEGQQELYCRKCGSFVKSLKNTMRTFTSAEGAVELIKVFRNDEFIEEATVKRECKKCKSDKAQMIVIPPLYGDEDDIVLYKCGNCKDVSREDSKVF